ncbi:MAG: hypothetical protein KY462_16700 [Actinobacteria bacterium]|nr:hypothetical protein [Actinomycetota bacterium]
MSLPQDHLHFRRDDSNEGWCGRSIDYVELRLRLVHAALRGQLELRIQRRLLAANLIFLVATIVAVVAASRASLSNRTGAGLIATGYSLIAVGVAIGLIVREELDWFFVLAGPGLLLSAVGSIVFAVGIWRRSSLPRWAAVLAGVGGLVAIILTEFGSGVLIGSFWLFVASYTRRNSASQSRRLA